MLKKSLTGKDQTRIMVSHIPKLNKFHIKNSKYMGMFKNMADKNSHVRELMRTNDKVVHVRFVGCDRG